MRGVSRILAALLVLAAAPALAVETSPDKGELRLMGKVVSVNVPGSSFVILARHVSRYPDTDPKNEADINPPRQKTIKVTDLSRIRLAQPAAQAGGAPSLLPAEKALVDLEQGLDVTAVGKDGGTGKPLTARLIYWMPKGAATVAPPPANPGGGTTTDPGPGAPKPAGGGTKPIEPVQPNTADGPQGDAQEARFPHWSAIDPATKRLFTSNMATANVAAISLETGRVIGTVSVGQRPEGIAVNSKTGRVYVACALENSVSVIDAKTLKVLSTVPVGQGPEGVSVNPKTNKIYVANQVDGTVSVIDGETANMGATIQVGAVPVMIGVNATTNRLYVTNSKDNTLTAIDGETNKVLGTMPVSMKPFGIAVDEVNNRVYVAHMLSDNVMVLDGQTGRPLGTVRVDGCPMGVTIGAQRVYVVCLRGGSVCIIDRNTGRPVDKAAGLQMPVSAQVDPATGRIWVTARDSNTVAVLDDKTLPTQTVATVKLAPTPGGEWPGKLPTD